MSAGSPGTTTGTGTLTFATSGVEVADTGATLLEQAEAAGLRPEYGCRMGICHTCVRKKTSGAVRNVVTGEVSDCDSETVQLCVNQPLGDVVVDL